MTVKGLLYKDCRPEEWTVSAGAQRDRQMLRWSVYSRCVWLEWGQAGNCKRLWSTRYRIQVCAEYNGRAIRTSDWVRPLEDPQLLLLGSCKVLYVWRPPALTASVKCVFWKGQVGVALEIFCAAQLDSASEGVSSMCRRSASQELDRPKKKTSLCALNAFMLPLSRREIRACPVDAQVVPHRQTRDHVALAKSRSGTSGAATGGEAEWTPCCHDCVHRWLASAALLSTTGPCGWLIALFAHFCRLYVGARVWRCGGVATNVQ